MPGTEVASGDENIGGTVNIGTMPNVTVNEPVSVDDNGGSLTVDIPDPSDLWQKLTNIDKVGYGFTIGSVSVPLAAETDFCLFQNPIGSGKLVRIWEQIPSLPGEATTVRSVIRLYVGSTITLAGAPVGVGGLRAGQPASPMLVSSLPTIAARGTLVQTYGFGNDLNQRNLGLGRYVEPGGVLLFTMTPTATTTPHSLHQAWAEVTP